MLNTYKFECALIYQTIAWQGDEGMKRKDQEKGEGPRGAQRTGAYTGFFREAHRKRLMLCVSRQWRTVRDMGAEPGV